MKNALFCRLLGDRLLLDMHVHTIYSGHANLQVKELFRIYKMRGIVPAITDHDNCKAWQEAERISKLYKHPFIKGEEIKVYHNNRFVGELLGLFMEEPVEPGEIFDVIDKLKEQQALISVAHPFDVLRKPLFSGFKMLDEIKNRIDAIEVFNSRCWLTSANTKAKEYASKNNLAFTAGTDAHFACELGKAFLIVDANSLEEARKKILAKECSYWGKPNSKKVHVLSWLAKMGFK